MSGLKLDKDLRNNSLLIIFGLVISIILPSDIFYIIRSFLKYIVFSYLNLWYLLVSYIVVLLIIKRKNLKFGFRFYALHILIITVLIVSLSTLITLKRQILLDKKLYIVYAGCFTQNSNGYLIKDNGAIKIDRLFMYEFEQSKKLHDTFSKGLTDLKVVDFPDLIMALMKPGDIKNLVLNKVNSNQILCVISYVRNPDNSNLEVNIDFNNKPLMDKDIYDRFAHIFTSISKDENINQEYLISCVSKFITAIVGQGVLHTYLLYKDLEGATKAVIDSENLIIEATEFLIAHGNESTISKAKSLRNYWLADLEIYKSEIHYKKGYLLSCLNHLFNALYYDLYYPHESYEEMKYRLLADYELEEDTLKKETNYFFYIKPTIERIIPILIKHKDYELVEYVKTRLNNLKEKYRDNPMVCYNYGEIIKYCYIPGKKINKVYVNRLAESINSFEKAIELDPTFSLVYTKLIGMNYITSQSITDSLNIMKYRDRAKKYVQLDMSLYDLENIK